MPLVLFFIGVLTLKMKTNKFIRLSGAFLIVAFFMCTDASAQYGGMGGGMGGGRRGMSSDRGARPDVAPMAPHNPSVTWLEQVSVQLNELQVDLKLSREQAPAWQRFAQLLNLNLEEMHRAPLPIEAGKAPSGMLIIRQAVDGARNRYGFMEDLEASARTLFVQLTAPQQSVFDARVSQWRFLQNRAE
jgi:hypothetical protein